jgi:hypothetical protein
MDRLYGEGWADRPEVLHQHGKDTAIGRCQRWMDDGVLYDREEWPLDDMEIFNEMIEAGEMTPARRNQ